MKKTCRVVLDALWILILGAAFFGVGWATRSLPEFESSQAVMPVYLKR
jgi:hypothetical protein